MDIKIITDQLKKHEGIRLKPYRCTAGKLTIGYGRNLDDNGISIQEAEMMLKNDIFVCLEDCEKIFGESWENLSDTRQHVLLDMRFNLGPAGIRQFKKMIAAIKRYDFESAAESMVNSKWYRQVGNRSFTLVNMMRYNNDCC